MLVSVIIATYNPEDYFFDCINSLLKQTLDKKFFKVYVVFNNTDINIENKFSQFLKNTNLVVEIISLSEPGVSRARNIGITSSSEKYICFLDDDDIISENYLENLMLNADEDTIVVSNVLGFIRFGDFINDYLTLSKKFFSISLLKCKSSFSTVWGKVIPRNIVENTLFSEKLKNGEDALFMFAISKNIRYVRSTNLDVYYFRRLRAGSASRSKKSAKYLILNFLKQFYLYTMYFIASPFKYSFIFLFLRYLAISKKLFIDLKKLTSD